MVGRLCRRFDSALAPSTMTAHTRITGERKMKTALSQLREKTWDIDKELEEAEEVETIAKGCRACGGKIESGIYRRTVTVAGIRFSEGSIAETFIVCSGCQSKIHKMLQGE